MTLVVGVIDGHAVHLVGDTKVTYDEDAVRTARVFTEAVVKIVLLRDDLAVGVSGDYPRETIEDLLKFRNSAPEVVVNHLERVAHGDYLVAALHPPRLWTVTDRASEAATEGALAWVGDQEAYTHFTRLFDSTAGEPTPSRLRSSMHNLVSPIGPVATVGGFAVAASSTSGAFRFLAGTFTIAPRAIANASINSSGNVVLRITARNNLSDWFSGSTHPGKDATPGALGIYIHGAKAGVLFSHSQPHLAVTIPASDPERFVAAAEASCGQRLVV